MYTPPSALNPLEASSRGLLVPFNYNFCDPNKILNQNQELTYKIAKCHQILI
jgi:hypothetical protein